MKMRGIRALIATLAISIATTKRCPVVYTSNDATYQFSQLAVESDPRLRTVGGVEKGCRDIINADPVSFVTSDAFLMLPQWKRSPSANFKFDFKTVEQRGLVLYVEDNTTNDFIALEFFDGNLYVVSSRSGMPKRAMVPPKNLTDGKWHTVALFLQTDRNELRIKIDQGRFLIFNLSGDFDWKLQGSMRLGGTDFSTMHSTGRTPQLLWTASLKYGYIGCIQNVLKDGGSIDLMTIAKQSYRGTSSIAPECLNYGGNFCDSQPCRNGGVCKNQLNGFTCDCTATAYSGDTCETATMVVGFNGSQCLRLPAPNTKRYQAEELSLRFKTPFSSGLLFATTSSNTADILLLRLVRGVVELTVNIDCFKTNCTNVTLRQGGTTLSDGSSLNDNRWHYIAVRRYGNIVSLAVDNSTAKARELPNGYFELEFNNIHLGKVTGDVFPNPRRDFGPTFVGMIQNVRFNKNQVADRCLSNKKSACQFNGTQGESVIISNSVTFENRYNYIWMEKLNAYESMNLYFTLRTTVADGLILYNDGPSGDFVAVELYNGFIRYVYDLGNGPQFLSAPDQAPISDGKWHQVRIIRTRLNQHTLSVDGVSLTQNGRRENVNLDLDGDLYIGGVRKDMYTKAIFTAIQSRFGFQGCLATFDLNGYNPDLVSEAALVNSGKVTQGCRGPHNACDSRPCLNNGVCRQEWNGYSCDCSMTAYSGGKCQEHISTFSGRPSYVFNEGVMIYNWPPDGLPSSREDRLVIHFSTSTRNCVLARIDSGLRRGNLKEFMELRIKNGRLKLTFNIGTKSTTMTSYMNVADGQYHVAVVERRWMNASMVVDRSPIQRVAPKGNANERYDLARTSIPPFAQMASEGWLRSREEKNTVFNSKSRIQIGGRLASSSNGQIIDTCAGMMTAFSFSGIRVFSLANNGDPRVQIIGDVTRYVETATPTPLSVTTTTMVTMTTFRTSSSKSLSIGNASACNEELCDESNETTTLDLENAMLRDGQTSQITPGAKIPSVVALTTKATPSATPIKTTRSALINPSPTTRVANNISNNGSGMDNLKADDTLKATGMFGNFFNGTTAVIAGIIGAAVLTIATLLWAIFKFKHRENNKYRKGHRSSPCHSNGHASVAGDSRNGTLRNNKKKSRRKNGSNVDQEYYV